MYGCPLCDMSNDHTPDATVAAAVKYTTTVNDGDVTPPRIPVVGVTLIVPLLFSDVDCANNTPGVRDGCCHWSLSYSSWIVADPDETTPHTYTPGATYIDAPGNNAADVVTLTDELSSMNTGTESTFTTVNPL
jgi:hypothetical protein